MNYYLDTEFLEGSQKKLFGYIKPTIDLISIGIVSEDNREYYAISKDFNLKEAWNRYDGYKELTNVERTNGFNPQKNYWIRDNVLIPIFFELANKDFHNTHFKDEWIYEGKEVTLGIFKTNYKWISDYKWFKKLINKYGQTNKEISEGIKSFTVDFQLDYYKKVFKENKPDKDCSDMYLGENQINFYAYYADYDWVVFCWIFGRMIDLPKSFPMYCIDLKQISDEIYYKYKESYEAGGGRNFINKMSNHLDYPKQVNEHNALDDARWNKRLHEFLNKL